MSQHQLKSIIDQRLQQRSTFEEFENVSLIFNINDQTYTSRIINLNTKGALISCEKIQMPEIQKGQIFENLQIYYEKKQIGFIDRAVVCHTQSNQFKINLGLVFESENKINTVNVRESNLRKKLRLLSSKKKPITGYFPHPFKYDESIYFEVIDINKDGMKISTSIRNRSILPGAQFDEVRLQIPTCPEIQVSGKIKYIDTNSNPGFILIHFVFLTVPDNFEQECSKYFISFMDAPANHKIESLKQAGIFPKKIKDRIEYSYIHTLEEYRKVLELRVRAYGSNGKIPENTRPDEMSDFFDTNSIIIVAKLQNHIIGSVRMTLCETNQDRYELDESIEIPKKINRLKTVEISRLSVDPSFHNTDTVHGLLERCTQMVMQKGLTHVITSCIDEMLPYYNKMGFRPLGKVFELKTLQGIPHHLLSLNIKTVRTSFNLNPVYWFFTYFKVVRHMGNMNTQYAQKLGFFKRITMSLMLKFYIKKKK